MNAAPPDVFYEDDRRLSEAHAEQYLGYRRGQLRRRRERGLRPHPSEVDERTAYYRMDELRRYSRGLYALEEGSE